MTGDSQAGGIEPAVAGRSRVETNVDAAAARPFSRQMKLFGDNGGLAFHLLKGETSLSGWEAASSDQPGCTL